MHAWADTRWMKLLLSGVVAALSLAQTALCVAENSNGKTLYLQRCAVCHGPDIKGTGPLAKKSNPPTPDLTTADRKSVV